MIRRVIQDGILIGSEFETGRAHFFFGAAGMKRGQLGTRFPSHKFCFLKQVHGFQIVHGDPEAVPEADGHITGRPNQALVIQTADCVPLLLANDSQVCALHAGWRGTASGIVAAAKAPFMEPPEVAVIGPHIHAESFEIHRDVSDSLLARVPDASRAHFVLPHKDPAKCYFNLAALLRFQLLSTFPEIQIFEARDNTFTSPAYHSYRRDQNGGQSRAPGARQYSFVVLKP
jgi:YfiH family protein